MGLFLSISSECDSAAVDIINCELGDPITPAKSAKKDTYNMQIQPGTIW